MEKEKSRSICLNATIIYFQQVALRFGIGHRRRLFNLFGFSVLCYKIFNIKLVTNKKFIIQQHTYNT